MYPQKKHLFFLMSCFEPFSASNCPCFSSRNGRLLKLEQNLPFVSIHEIYSLIGGFVVQHIFLVDDPDMQN